MEAYKKLKARKSKHTHIKPPKKEKKKPAWQTGGGVKSGQPPPPRSGEREGTERTVDEEEEAQQRKVYSRRKVSSNAYRYELEESHADGNDTALERRAPSLKELLDNAASKDPSSHFRFREEREWNEIATATQTKGGLDFEKLGRSITTLPLAVRLRLEGDLFGENKPIDTEAYPTDSESEAEEGEAVPTTEEIQMQADAEPAGVKSSTPQGKLTSPAETKRLPTVSASEVPKQDNSDDLLDELLSMPDEDVIPSAATAVSAAQVVPSTPSSSGQDTEGDLEAWLDSVI